MANRESILHHKLWKLFFTLSLPGIMGMVLVSVHSLADAIFISRLVGADAFSGVSLSLPLFTIQAAVTTLLASGAAITYSRAIGSSNSTVLQHLFKHLLWLTILAAVAINIIGFCFGKSLLRFLGTDKQFLSYGLTFYQWSIAGCFPSIFGLCLNALIRAEGNIKYAMSITALSVVINLAINPLLIQVFHLGVKGSAVATIISMSIYALLNLRYFIKHQQYLRPCLRVKLQWTFIRSLLHTGLPSFLMQLNGVVRQFILFKIAGSYSNDGQFTFFSAVYRLFSFAAIPVFGLLQALQPIVGINYGAGNISRIQSAMKVFRTGSICLMLATALPGILFPQTVLSILLPAGPIIQAPLSYFQLVLCVLPLMPLASTSIVLLQATGNSKKASVLTLSREFLIFIPVISLFTYVYGYAGIYYGLFIENIIYILLVFLVTRHVQLTIS